MSKYKLIRDRKPQDGRVVRMTHDGETAVGVWRDECWEMQVASPGLRDLALRHGWRLAGAQTAAAPAPAPAAAPVPPPPAPAPESPVEAAEPEPELAPLREQAALIVQGTVEEVERALDDWHVVDHLQLIALAERNQRNRKGVRRAIARRKRELEQA